MIENGTFFVCKSHEGLAVNDRITELEIRFSLMEDLVEELNQMVFRQQEQVSLLQAQLRHLYGQLQANAQETEAPRSLREEIPPHY